MIQNRRNFLKRSGLIGSTLLFIQRGHMAIAQPAGMNSVEENFQDQLNKKRGHTYYIDPALGNDSNDGLNPLHPFKTYSTREFSGGDRVLFKRGSVIRDMLHTRDGMKGAPITYGAYGEGEKPAFLGSVSVANPEKWMEERPHLWKYDGKFSSKVCNLIFNGGESCGNLRWDIAALKQPGEWHYTGNSTGDEGGGQNIAESVLYLCSSGNPGIAYRDIECVLWGERKLVGGQGNIILENLSFRNSGVHGYQEFHPHDIIIRACEFRFIGGAVWNHNRRIRFGNAIELWDGASDITIEHCFFDNIYDAGVTHQGGETRNIPQRIFFRHNHFSNCGLASYECREPSQEVYFENNISINAGGGFSMQGDLPPRQSEIYPQPVGHHVFIWRVNPGTQPGNVFIRNNVFSEAPYGAAIYSIIDPVDEQKFILDYNHYSQTTGEILIHLGGRSYKPSEFNRYQQDCRQDTHSKIVKPD